MAAATEDEEQPPSYHALFGQPGVSTTVQQQPLLSPTEVEVQAPPSYDEPPAAELQPLPVTEPSRDGRHERRESPPPYDPSLRDSPPSYDSLFGRVIAVRNQSSGRIDFLKKIYDILRETLGCTLFLGLVLAVPFTMIIMGLMHLFDCPAEPHIPLYLLVGGLAVTAKIVKTLLEMYTCQDCTLFHQKSRSNNVIEALFMFFIIGWFIAGNMWIYRTHGRFDGRNELADNYCSPYVFYFAFWLTTSVYIIFAFLLCCMYAISALGSKSS